MAFIKWVGGILFVIYIALSLIHLSNGFTFAESLEMPFRDGRMAIACPQKPSVVWDFINRNQMESLALGFAMAIGSDVYKEICKSEFPARI